MKQKTYILAAVLLTLCLCLLGNPATLAAAAEQISLWTTSLEYDLEITEPMLEELPDGTGRFTAKAVCRESVVGSTVKVAVAFYNTEGRMADCWLGIHTLAAEGTLTVEGTLPEYASVGVYFFDSETLSPIRPAVLRLLDGQSQVTAAQLSELRQELEGRLAALEAQVNQLSATTEELSATAYGVTPGVVDMEKMSVLLSTASEENRTIRFADGIYVFSDTIRIPSNTSLVGGANTVFALDEASTATDLMCIGSGVDNVYLAHLILKGGLTDMPTEEGTRCGLRVDSAIRVNLENIEIDGFDRYGFYGARMSSNSNGEFYKMLQITNCRLYNNYYGMCLGPRCEYTQVLNCVFGNNYVGCLNQGGNNSYVSCIFNVNTIGFQMDSAGLSNPAHGGCNGCTFNHNNSAVVVNDCEIGWIFDGCQIFYGNVILKESRGVVFNSCIFGSCVLNSTHSQSKNANLISDSFFQTDSGTILAGNDGSTAVVNCLPDCVLETSPDAPSEEDGWIQLLYTQPSTASSAASVDAYFAPITHQIPAGSSIDIIDIALSGTTSAGQSVADVDVWIGNALTGEVTEHLVQGETMTSVFSPQLNKYVLRISVERTYSYPVFVAMEAERTKGRGIAYGKSDSTINHFNGEGLSVGDILTANSNYIPEFAVYTVPGESSEPEADTGISPGSSWSGKSVVFVGDSITAGTGTTKTYCEYLEESMGFGSVTVMGVGGSCMSTASDYGTGNSPLINRWQSIPNADLIVIFMGTNDYGHETPLGTIDDSGDESFYGALNTIIPGIVTAHPHSRVVVLTPLHRYGAGTSKLLGERFTYDHLPNGRGHTLGDYVDALEAVCERWSVPVIDLFSESGIHPAVPAQKTSYMPDGIHPNAAGHEKIAYLIKNCLELYGTVEPPTELPGEAPELDTSITLRYGNKFVSDLYGSDPARASSVTNLWLTAGQTVTLLDTEHFKWALAGTDSATSSVKTHGYYPESQWSSIPSCTIQTDGWYGVVLLRTDGAEFSFEDGTHSDQLFDYISVD